MNLNFISPVYLLGLLGISLPILVHLLTRRRQTHIKFSAVYLLFRSEKRSIKRSRPNRLLLLLFRCLAIIGLSLALANPIFSLCRRSWLSIFTAKPKHFGRTPISRSLRLVGRRMNFSTAWGQAISPPG